MEYCPSRSRYLSLNLSFNLDPIGDRFDILRSNLDTGPR
ncbi:hypothetical protein CKA32_003768 [Geitlerinema sp. FC II]|nr:hypothetical protein CKA32_003768 [Geitlerinema sp. FC II]